MRRRTFVASAAGFLGANAFARGASLNAGEADLIVTNGTIHTVDPRFPNPEAFVVRNGRFAFVGSLRGARDYAKRGAKTLDLAHATVLPGLIDAHMHLVNVGMALHEVDLFHLTSYDDVIRKTVDYARTSPDTWVIGDGWDQNLWAGGAFPTHDALSAALPNRPVILRRVDDHALLANAKAMELAGVTQNTPDPAGGRIVHDASGAPTGVFIDNARALITKAIPPPTDDQIRRATIAAIGECNRWGITAIGDPGVTHQMAQAYDKVADRACVSGKHERGRFPRVDLLAIAFQRERRDRGVRIRLVVHDDVVGVAGVQTELVAHPAFELRGRHKQRNGKRACGGRRRGRSGDDLDDREPVRRFAIFIRRRAQRHTDYLRCVGVKGKYGRHGGESRTARRIGVVVAALLPALDLRLEDHGPRPQARNGNLGNRMMRVDRRDARRHAELNSQNQRRYNARHTLWFEFPLRNTFVVVNAFRWGIWTVHGGLEGLCRCGFDSRILQRGGLEPCATV